MDSSFFLVLGVFVASGITRLFLGYPIRRPMEKSLVFQETWTTGYPAFSNGFIITAANCMWVHVTKDRVSVRPHFPFSVFLIPEFIGLGWEFPKTSLLSCSKTLCGVRVRYKGLFADREFVIHVGDRDGFIKAVSNA